MEDRAEIRRLRRAEGVSVSEIARLLGISRNTLNDHPHRTLPQFRRVLAGSSHDSILLKD